jgi:hypothetical protein
MSEFQREDRYIVIKRSDIEKAPADLRRNFYGQCRKLHDSMLTNGAPARSFLVIESDWPEYEPTWQMIEDRVAGRSHPLQQVLRENGDLIAAQATIAQQAQMIEHLRGGPTPGFTAVDMTTAAADGFRDGAASVVVDLEPDDLINEAGDYLYIEFVRARITAAGGRIKE